MRKQLLNLHEFCIIFFWNLMIKNLHLLMKNIGVTSIFVVNTRYDNFFIFCLCYIF